MNKRQKWGVILLVGPFALLIILALVQFIFRFIFGSVAGGSGGDALILVINIISLIVGVVAVLGFIPSVIVGIIFLATPGEKTELPTSRSPQA
jgi:hypothetical protein